MLDFSNKTALVTGATGGIGRCVVEQLVKHGATVAITDRDLEMLTNLKKELNSDKVFVYPCNLTDTGSVAELVKQAEADMGKIDVLVNNAGVTKDTLSIRMTDEQWQMVLDINLTAAFRLSRAVLMGMMKRRYGRIVSLASVVGAMGNAGQANYAASKAGLIAMSKSIAQEVASRGITLNCVAPGFIQTPMTAILPEAVKERMIAAIPTGTFGQPKDVANAVLFLAAEESGYITGQTIHVNGGMAML